MKEETDSEVVLEGGRERLVQAGSITHRQRENCSKKLDIAKKIKTMQSISSFINII